MPLGLPVEPEVYRINNGSSASMISATLLSVASSKSGCNHWSRPDFIFIEVLVLFTTKTFFTQGLLSNASSMIPFKSIVLLPRYPPSEVITISHSQSLILAATADAENPAKTTECMAPILAQAKTETANSGIIGK